MEAVNLLGLTGAFIAGAAYVPQIIHLIKERCSAGISRSTFALLLLSSLLLAINAYYIGAAVFVVLGVIEIVSSTIICAYSTKYKAQVCPFHIEHPENK